MWAGLCHSLSSVFYVSVMITIIVVKMMIMMMMMMSILTSTISAFCSFYSYTPRFPSLLLFAFLISLYPLFYSAIFMEDTAEEVRIKIKKAYCPPEVVENNPVMDYATSIGKLPHPLIALPYDEYDNDKEYTNLCNLCILLFLFMYSSPSISFFYCT